MEFGLELLLDVSVVFRIVGGDGNFEFIGEETKVLDKVAKVHWMTFWRD